MIIQMRVERERERERENILNLDEVNHYNEVKHEYGEQRLF